MIITAQLGGQPVTIHAPGPGEIDPFAEVPVLPTGENPGDAGTFMGLDVESNGRTDPFGPGFEVRTVQLAPADDSAWVFRLDDSDQAALVQDVIGWEANQFASHTKIDVHSLGVTFGHDLSERNLDTQVLAVMAAPDDVPGQASLKPVADRYGMPELGQAEEALDARFLELYRQAHPELGKRAVAKAKLKAWGFANVPVTDRAFVVYAALDAIAVRRLAPLLATASNNPPHVLTTERWLSSEAVRLERRGQLVDRERLEEIASAAQAAEAQAAEVVLDHTGLKTTQNVKLQEWLGHHGVDWSRWPATMRTDKGAPSLAKANVTNLRTFPLDEAGQAVVEAMVSHAGLIDKLKRTSEVRSCLDANGRTHGTLYTVGTVTSRMSSAGPNMQNFSKKDPTMRGIYVADPGYVLMSCDFAQIELRVLAALAREFPMIETILEGGDLHQLTADLLAITRQQAKTVNFLIVYGGGGPRLASQLGHAITESEGRAIVKRYWSQYPAIASLNQFMKAQTSVRLISGRYVPVGTRSHAAMNYLIQGSARELLVGAWRRFNHEAQARGLDARIWFPIHDELVIQVREDQAQEAAQLAGECMTFGFYGVPVQAEADIMIDRDGRSRWMTGDLAKEIAAELAA